MLLAYLGGDERNYQDYLDARTGRMLEAAPGRTYDVKVAPGRNPGLPLPPGDGRWAPAAAPAFTGTAQEHLAELIAGTDEAPQAAESAAEPGPASEVIEPPLEHPGEPETPPEPESALPSLPGEDTPDQAAAEAAPNPGGDE